MERKTPPLAERDLNKLHERLTYGESTLDVKYPLTRDNREDWIDDTLHLLEWEERMQKMDDECLDNELGISPYDWMVAEHDARLVARQRLYDALVKAGTYTRKEEL